MAGETTLADETAKLPLWQVGLVLGGLSVPHYTGSNQRYNLPFVLPAFIYRGDRLRATREGVRGIFFSSKNFALDLGLAIGLPVDSKRNDARKDMTDIPLTVEIGPRIVTRLYGDGSGIDIFARIPWRVVGGIDGSAAGWTLEPGILITNIKNLPWDLNAFASLGLKYGSAEYNNLFYGVEDRDSTSLRPAYRAKRGISWYSFVFSTGRKFNSKFSTRLYLQWRTLSGSEVADSPLVINQNNYGVSLVFTWLPWKSKATESGIDRLPEPEGDI